MDERQPLLPLVKPRPRSFGLLSHLLNDILLNEIEGTRAAHFLLRPVRWERWHTKETINRLSSEISQNPAMLSVPGIKDWLQAELKSEVDKFSVFCEAVNPADTHVVVDVKEMCETNARVFDYESHLAASKKELQRLQDGLEEVEITIRRHLELPAEVKLWKPMHLIRLLKYGAVALSVKLVGFGISNYVANYMVTTLGLSAIWTLAVIDVALSVALDILLCFGHRWLFESIPDPYQTALESQIQPLMDTVKETKRQISILAADCKRVLADLTRFYEVIGKSKPLTPNRVRLSMQRFLDNTEECQTRLTATDVFEEYMRRIEKIARKHLASLLLDPP